MGQMPIPDRQRGKKKEKKQKKKKKKQQIGEEVTMIG
jgi:hypothetical protein